MDIEKLKKEIEKNLLKAQGERQSKIEEINKNYDAKISKLETERKSKLANVPGNEKDIKKLQNALTALGGSDGSSDNTEGERVPFPTKKIEVPAKYEDAKTWNSKIVFALSKIGTGTNDDVIAKLIELDKTFDADKTGNTITQTLSSLKTKSAIQTTGKKGKRDIYTLV